MANSGEARAKIEREASGITGAQPLPPTQKPKLRRGDRRSRAPRARPLRGLTAGQPGGHHRGGSAEQRRATVTTPDPTPTIRPSRSAGAERPAESGAESATDQWSAARWLCGAGEGVPGQPTKRPHDSKIESFMWSFGRLAGDLCERGTGSCARQGRSGTGLVPKTDREGLMVGSVLRMPGGGVGDVAFAWAGARMDRRVSIGGSRSSYQYVCHAGIGWRS